MGRRSAKPTEKIIREYQVESLDFDAQGIAHNDEGKVIFIDGALPGERVLAETVRVKAAFEKARVVQVLKESVLRVKPQCKYFGICGGCSMQHLEHSAQIAIKQRTLEDTLWHIGKVKPEQILRPIEGEPWGYRYRARLSVRLVDKKGGMLIGFHEKSSSYVADMTSCEVLPRHVSDLLVPLRRLLESLSAPDRYAQIEVACGEALALTPSPASAGGESGEAGCDNSQSAHCSDERSSARLRGGGGMSLDRGDLNPIEDSPHTNPLPQRRERGQDIPLPHKPERGQDIPLPLMRERGQSARITALVLRHLVPITDYDAAKLRAFAEAHTAAGIEWWLQAKSPEDIHTLDGTVSQLSYRLPEFGIHMPFKPTDFTQVNHRLNAVLVSRALRLLQVGRDESVIDWFCGLGNFTLPLATQARQVLGIEGSETLVARAQANAGLNGLAERARFEARNLFELSAADVKAIVQKSGAHEKWLIDPPREGALALAKAAVELHEAGEGALLPKRIVYVSCNPATLARDASLFAHDAGYTLRSAGIANMFPHTSHVESIAVFER